MELSEANAKYEEEMHFKQHDLKMNLAECLRQTKQEPGLSNLQIATIIKNNLDQYDIENIIKELKVWNIQSHAK